MMMMLRTVLADDEPLARRRLAMLLREAGCEVAAELADGQELRARFEQENDKRQAAGKEPYPLDEPFLAAQKDLPPCCGVSVGFDRVLMLQTQVKYLSDILPFSWEL